MKSCIQCGTEAYDNAPACEVCGREFAFRGNDKDGGQVAKPMDTTEARPDGKLMVGLGWAGLGIGAILLIASFSVNVSPYGEIDPGKIATQWSLMLGGAGLANIGLLLLLVGIVVRAISFLPGKDGK